ncbi:MAG: type II toxin-antitoxin system VapC family toxin [Dehalococcoidia bacterium]
MAESERLLLDTHAWVWWIDQSQPLAEAARNAVNAAERLWVSVISCWEIAQLVSHERLRLSTDIDIWIDTALKVPRLEMIGLTPQIAVASNFLPGVLTRDPADRIIVATARVQSMTVVTRDRAMRQYPFVRTIWQ